MLVVEVKVGTAQGREITLKSGAKKQVAEQIGFIEVSDEVRKIRVPIDVEGGQKPYEPGSYVIDVRSYNVGKFHDLQINPYELRLVPLASVVELVRASRAA